MSHTSQTFDKELLSRFPAQRSKHSQIKMDLLEKKQKRLKIWSEKSLSKKETTRLNGQMCFLVWSKNSIFLLENMTWIIFSIFYIVKNEQKQKRRRQVTDRKWYFHHRSYSDACKNWTDITDEEFRLRTAIKHVYIVCVEYLFSQIHSCRRRKSLTQMSSKSSGATDSLFNPHHWLSP